MTTTENQAKASGNRYTTHIYTIGTKKEANDMNDARKGFKKWADKEKAHEIYVKKPNILYHFLAKATQLKI